MSQNTRHIGSNLLKISLTFSGLQRADTLMTERVETGKQFRSTALHIFLA